MLSKKVELIILNALLIAGITVSGLAAYQDNQAAPAASASAIIQSEQSNNSDSQISIDKTTNESLTIDKTCPATAGGNGCSSCSSCSGQCGFGYNK